MDAAFVVADSAGQKLAYVYFEDEPGRRTPAKLMTRDDDGTELADAERALLTGIFEWSVS